MLSLASTLKVQRFSFSTQPRDKAVIPLTWRQNDTLHLVGLIEPFTSPPRPGSWNLCQAHNVFDFAQRRSLHFVRCPFSSSQAGYDWGHL